ncbi:class I SAM-dependent methyltransferase [Orrella marina]|uniref:SAM-dependent methyltransferase n=1 Tax=Orrella marina TaxID=2163011 RepID=A0A2R4XLA7_9BURK|nr:SAM-dependent methyltransferase [Orrella marina]AWB34554.1 hypothetical protein DBV39_13470 [Orrella marina]
MSSVPDHPAQSHVQQGVRVSAAAFEHSQRVSDHLHRCIARAGGWLSFKDWMTEVLYAPGLGYYTAGSRKLAQRSDPDVRHPGGDFVTAPELSPAFGRTLALQISQAMTQNGLTRILEFGAGSGQLAQDIIEALHALGVHNFQYSILEISQDLRERQQAKLPATAKVQWIDTLPDTFEGIVLANEVLDAMPVHVLRWNDDASGVLERGVISLENDFAWQDRRAESHLEQTLRERMPALPGYTTEINLPAEAWTRTLASHLKRGLVLLVDYGFSRLEYYHPQRNRGTLMCHIQHRAHDNPFFAPGLQDITAHVDFSAVAASAHQSGLDVLGYTSQARFLLNAGLHDVLTHSTDLQTTQAMRAVEKLVSEAEMGELFKVLALGRDIDPILQGFVRADRLHQL